MNRGAGQSREVGGRADMVRVEVGDDDALHRVAQLVQHPRPALPRVGEAESRVHDDPPAARGRKEVAVHVIDPQRQGERHTSDSGV
jgi:hypothetical protein